MKSWDCFDTLIARRFMHPHSIFEEVGNRLNIPNFKEIRIQAERLSGSTYENIYKNIPGVDPQIEIDVEHEHCFPIVENLEQVQDGDMIISDMYHSPEVIMSLLRKCGLNKDVHLIVTSGGKSSGEQWEKLLKNNVKIKQHCGDNLHSDVTQAIKYGFQAKLCTKYKFTEFESSIKNNDNFSLACFIRFLRLQYSPLLFSNINKNFAYNFWLTQCYYNIPSLCLFAKYLEDKGDLAFIYRDCHILHPLYETITQKKGIEFNCSRRAAKNKSNFFIDYANKTIQNRTLVDLHGTGATAFSLFPNNNFITLTKASNDNTACKLYTAVVDRDDDFIEKTNLYELGTLLDVDENGHFIRKECEHHFEDVILINHIKKISISNCSNFEIKRNDFLLNNLIFKNLNFSCELTGARVHVAYH